MKYFCTPKHKQFPGCSHTHGRKMVSACYQVSVHDCGNANVGNLCVVIRVRNSVVCAGLMRVEKGAKGSKGHLRSGNMCSQFEQKCSHSTNLASHQENTERPQKYVLGFLTFVAKHQGTYARKKNARYRSPQTTGHGNLHRSHFQEQISVGERTSRII